MCSPSAPPPPDYAGAAAAQGAANVDTAVAQGHINNPNVVTPWGSQTVTWNGQNPTLTQNLSPGEQAIYEQNMWNRRGLGGLAANGINSLTGLIGTNLNLSGTPAAGRAYTPDGRLAPSANPQMYQGKGDLPDVASGEDTRSRVIQAMLTRSNDEIGKQEEQVKSDLIARGLRPGTEAYAREMDTLGKQRNDAMALAEVAGGNAAQQEFAMDAARRAQLYGEGTTDASLLFGQGLQAGNQNFQQRGQASELFQNQQGQQFNQSNDARRQAIAELLTRRQTPLNEIVALMSGSQVQNPFSMPGYAQNTQVAPPPIFGAATAAGGYGTDAYNAGVGSNNSMMSGLFGLGSSWIRAGMPGIG